MGERLTDLFHDLDMKRANCLLTEILERGNLQLAFWKAGKGKRYTRDVLQYQKDLENLLDKLHSSIALSEVDVGNYYYFTIYEPKKREICAAAFKEQVLHHALMNVCHRWFDRRLIYDTYACRKGKGTYAALDRAKRFNKQHRWYLKLDVRKFFASIHHDVLKSQLARLFKEQRLLSIFYQIIDSYEASLGRGLPIGNLTSQYFANHYLSGLDHYIKEELRIKAYVRYMDDMVLWSQDKQVLLNAQRAIEGYIESKLRLSLKPMQLNRVKLGLPFLGYRLFPYHVRLLRKSRLRFVKKLQVIYDAKATGRWEDAVCQRKVLPLLAFIGHADSDVLRKSVISNIKG
jgi:hypothetical protein